MFEQRVALIRSIGFAAKLPVCTRNAKITTKSIAQIRRQATIILNGEGWLTKGDRENMIRRVFLVAVLAVLLLSLFGCQTVAGMGRDVTGASEAVEGWITRP